MRTVNNSMIVMLSAAIVAACGGGGGGETGASVRAPLAINAGNGVRLAKDVVAGGEAVSGSGGSAADTRSRGEIPGLRALTYDLVLQQLDAGVPTGGGITTAETATENCPAVAHARSTRPTKTTTADSMRATRAVSLITTATRRVWCRTEPSVST